MSRIKGVPLINSIGVLRDMLGPARLQAMTKLIPAASQPLFSRSLVALEWVPLDQWAPVLQVVFEQLFRKDELQFRRLMRAVCKRDFSGIYRVYVKNTTPHEVLNKAASIWTAYFDTGSLTTEPAEVPNGLLQVTLKMRELQTEFPILATVMLAYIEQILDMAGAEKFTIQRGKELLMLGKLSCDYQINFVK